MQIKTAVRYHLMPVRMTIIKEYITKSKPIRFDGNGYSDEWKQEALHRGLDCQTSVPLIFDNYLTPESIEMFAKTNVLTAKELQSRCEVKWDTYTKKIQIEARVLGDLAMNHIIPVASRYQLLLLDAASKISANFTAEKAAELNRQNISIIENIATHSNAISIQTEQMIEARKAANIIDNEREKAIAYHDTVAPLLDSIRYHIDKLELIVDNQMWPLPKYRELLFMR